MTWRCIWGEPMPMWADHDDEDAATLDALRRSRETGQEVAVVKIEGDEA